MEIKLSRSILNFYIAITVVVFSIIGCKSSNNITRQEKKLYINSYKFLFLSLCFDKFQRDTIWHDRTECSVLDFDKQALSETNNLVNRVDSVIRKQIDETIDDYPEGYHLSVIPDTYCVAEECMKIFNSQELDKLAKSFARRKMRQKNKYHRFD